LEVKTNRETTQQVDPLLHHAISSNRGALDELFERHRPRLYHTALRLMGNSDDAEDALQDGLLAAFRNLSGFKGRSQFSTWLMRIVINAALMRLRRMRPELMTSIDRQLDPDEQPWANRIRDPGPNPEEMYARQERLQILEQKLESLPTAYRQALWLCDVQGMSTREAAEVLGLPTGTLKSQLHRARLRLSIAARHENVGPAPLLGSGRALGSAYFGPRRDHAAITRHRPTLEFTAKVTQPAA
jgi:RNA polymerase sigma-70 factor, ECF subfamily